MEAVKGIPAILNGANESNYEALSKVATAAGVPLGVSAANLDALHDTIAALEGLGNKKLFISVNDQNIKKLSARLYACAVLL